MNGRNTLVAAIAVAALLAGCTTQQTGIHNAYAQRDVCSKAVIAQPEFAALASHTHIGPEIPASELADERLPTPDEARLVVARWDAAAPCRQAFLAAMAGPPSNRPDAAQIMSALFAQGGMTYARFAKADMSWGQFAQARQALDIAWKAQLGAADAEARREAADRALAAAAIIGATMPRPPQPQTIYVAPCDINARSARAC
jgi:hypothetical protein